MGYLGATKLYNYHYDQLNRIAAINVFNGLNPVAGTFTLVSISDYQERVTYNPNGNSLTHLRNGDAAPVDYNKYIDIKQGQTAGNMLKSYTLRMRLKQGML